MTFSEFKTVFRLVTAHAIQHPGRMFLTALSTIAAACVVVWVVSGYDSLTSKFDAFEEGYLGRYQLLVLPTPSEGGGFRMTGPALDASLVDALKADASVAFADPMFQTRVRVRSENSDGTPEPPAGIARPEITPGAGETPATPAPRRVIMSDGGRANRTPTLVGIDATEPPHPLREGRWINPETPDAEEGVLTAGTAEFLKVKLGDEVLVSKGQPFGMPRGAAPTSPETRIKIIGIVEQPTRLPGPTFRIGLPPSRDQALTRGPATYALYVPIATAAELSGEKPRHSFMGVILKKGTDPEEFQSRWSERLAKLTPPAESQSLQDVGQEIEQSTTFEGVRNQAYAATGISLLAALFIIFTTLSMGVAERIRQFAMLRAIGLTKAQIGAMLAIESVLLGLIGWGGGILAGWGLLTIIHRWKPGLFPDGVSLGYWCILLSGACALGGALAASIVPAWRATRVRPLDAMAVRSSFSTLRFPWIASIVGLILITINPLLVFWVPMADKSRYAASAAIGCVSMGLGFILLAPIVILFTEKVLSRFLARLLMLNPRLLSTQLTGNLWRTLGVTSALTLGLGLFVAMQTWGYSMLGPFTPGQWVPDMIVGLPSGVPESAIDQVRKVPGVVSDQCVAIANEQVKFATDVVGAKVRATASRQDNCVMIGVDPDQAIGGNKPMFNFRFVEGTREEALAKFKKGAYCLVPDHFQRESGLGVGDKFAVINPSDPKTPVEYEIAGVVNMDGWHWMSKVGLRNRGGGRSAGLMFAPYERVRDDFKIKRITYFWMNLDGTKTEAEVRESLLEVAKANPGERPGRGGVGRGRRGPANEQGDDAAPVVADTVALPTGVDRREAPAIPAGDAVAVAGAVPAGPMGRGRGGPNIQFRSADGVRREIRERADGIIWALCQLPLVTLAVTALGVVNTVASSVRARRWDLGVLRAVGLTRFGLFRLILAEAILVGLVACLLSLGFGLMAGYCGTGVTRYINVRGGMITPLVIPWYSISIGFGLTLGLCLLSALGPAMYTAATKPLKLLQAGRAIG
jgi:putative ABC transport system permease protein